MTYDTLWLEIKQEKDKVMIKKQRSKLIRTDSIILTCWDNAVTTLGYYHKRSKTKWIICIIVIDILICAHICNQRLAVNHG